MVANTDHWLVFKAVQRINFNRQAEELCGELGKKKTDFETHQRHRNCHSHSVNCSYKVVVSQYCNATATPNTAR